MTVIAYRDGVMAADTQGEIDDTVKVSNVIKIIRANGHLIGFAGNDVPPEQKMVEWFFSSGDVKPKMAGYKFDLLVVAPDGTIAVWDQRGFSEPVKHKFWAIGIGSPAALALMETGVSAPSAVAACIKWIPGCGGKVAVRRIKDIASKRRNK